jgi:hypothetical protein
MCRPISSRLSRVASLLEQSLLTSSSSAVGGKTFIFSLLTDRLEALGVATSKNELKTNYFKIWTMASEGAESFRHSLGG